MATARIHENWPTGRDLHVCKGDQESRQQVEDLIKSAELDLRCRSLRDWVQGNPQERVWLTLHEAEWRELLTMRSEQLLAVLPGLIVKCRARLHTNSSSVRDVQRILELYSHRHRHPDRLSVVDGHTEFRLTVKERATIAAMVRDAYAASDKVYAETLTLRNRLLLLSLAGLVIVGIVLAWAEVQGWHLTPATSAVVNSAPAQWRDTPEPVGAFGFIAVALLGIVGGFLSGIGSVTRAARPQKPYSLPLWQLWLKLPIGSLSAMVGIFALQSRAFPAVPATGWTDLLMWAVAFGAAQQAITRLVDQRVQS